MIGSSGDLKTQDRRLFNRLITQSPNHSIHDSAPSLYRDVGAARGCAGHEPLRLAHAWTRRCRAHRLQRTRVRWRLRPPGLPSKSPCLSRMTIWGCFTHSPRRFRCLRFASSAPKNCCALSSRCTWISLRRTRCHPALTSAAFTWSIPALRSSIINAAFADGHRSGVLAEELTVASLIQTLSANIPGIFKVKILVEGKQRDTLAGHADLSALLRCLCSESLASQLQSAQ